MYADICRLTLQRHIMPVFGNKKLSRITVRDIEEMDLFLTGYRPFEFKNKSMCYNISRYDE